MKAPFRVPANTRILLIVYISNCGFRGSSPKSNINLQKSNFARIGGHRPPLQRNSVPEFRRCEEELTPYGFVMKNSNFRIIPLATEVAATARRVAESGASDHAIVVAGSLGGFLCRHCLPYSQAGALLILFPCASIPAGH